MDGVIITVASDKDKHTYQDFMNDLDSGHKKNDENLKLFSLLKADKLDLSEGPHSKFLLQKKYEYRIWRTDNEIVFTPQSIVFTDGVYNDDRMKCYSDYILRILRKTPDQNNRFESLFIVLHSSDLFSNYVDSGIIPDFPDLSSIANQSFMYHYHRGDGMSDVLFNDDVDEDFLESIKNIIRR